MYYDVTAKEKKTFNVQTFTTMAAVQASGAGGFYAANSSGI
jgi:hypothetical protein